MKKIFCAVTLLVSGLSFAAVEQSVENSMGKIATAANEGVSSVVHGVQKMAGKTEQMGAMATQKIENKVDQMESSKKDNFAAEKKQTKQTKKNA